MGSKKIESNDNLLIALVSGTTSAAATALITYPLDCLKTQQQLNNDIQMKKFNAPGNYPGSLAQLYKGCSALVAGSILKSSARLVLYNWLTKFMAVERIDKDGNMTRKTSAPRMVVAGMMSAFIETLWIIPFENIKITMIQNMTLTNEATRFARAAIPIDITGAMMPQKHQKPFQNIFTKQYISPHAYYTNELLAQYKGGKSLSKFHPQRSTTHKDSLKLKYNKNPSNTLNGAINEIYQIKGLQGFTAGTFITMLRQIGTTTVWLSTYNATRQLISPQTKGSDKSWFGHKQTAIQLFGLNVLSSFAVIAVTQPLDVIKSHMQLKNGKSIYKDSLSTAYQLFVGQGYKSMWKGALPRTIKVIVSGALTAYFYDAVEKIVFITNEQMVFLPE